MVGFLPLLCEGERIGVVNCSHEGWFPLRHLVHECSGFFQGRSLSMQQQMMQQSRQLDPNLLMKQQTPPSQQQTLHQSSMKSFFENVIPHATPELQKGPSPINAFSSFPIGGFLWVTALQSSGACGVMGCTAFSFVTVWVFPYWNDTDVILLALP